MNDSLSFGQWLRRRRRTLNLTQAELARRAGCAMGTIRKIEADELHPSESLAEVLAEQLHVASDELTWFFHLARRGALDDSQSSPPIPPRERSSLTNLPLPLTSFIGREQEIIQIKQLLASTRLLTCTGVGGSGKTRLALQVALSELNEYLFPNGIWLVELASLSDPNLVPHRIAGVFGLGDFSVSSSSSAVRTLAQHLRPQTCLIILDNCEHLIDACARLCESLLSACPNVKLLATSREALGIAGEISYRVPSLSLPPRDLGLASTLQNYESVRLFVERAALARSDFRLTDSNASAVAQIVSHLDGIPLAIELAAARCKTLTPQEIAARLDDRFGLLVAGSRTGLPRQQTLRATLDWSYDLLTAEERVLFRRLSVFAGGWTLQAADALGVTLRQVESDPSIARHPLPTVLDTLSRLVDKSLVLAEEQGETTRDRMLETVRQYAGEKLSESGEGSEVRSRHLDFFLTLAEQAEQGLKGAEQKVWSERLVSDYDNIRAALAWALETDADRAVRLGRALMWFWGRHGYIGEGLEWAAKLMSQTTAGRAAPRAMALIVAGTLEWWRRDLFAARDLFQSSLALAREAQDKRLTAIALLGVGMSNVLLGDPQAARDARPPLEESLALFKELGDAWHYASAVNYLGIAALQLEEMESAHKLFQDSDAELRQLGDRYSRKGPLTNLGEIARVEGDYARARALHEEALAVSRQLSQKSMQIGTVLCNLGHAVLREGDSARALTLFLESLAIARDQGSQDAVSLSLMGLAGVLVALGKPEPAAQLFGAIQTLRQAIGMSDKMDPADRADYEYHLARVRSQLDTAAFDQAWSEGAAMTLEQVIALVEQATEPTAQTSVAHPAGLTARQVEVLRLLALGLSNQEIADQLVLSRRTVHAHLRSIYGKLDVATRSAATRAAIENKLV